MAATRSSPTSSRREDGFPLLNDDDESTILRAFSCGPAVRHGNQSFCFIYKYRQRFAVVAKKVATALNLPADDLEMYRMGACTWTT